MDQMDNKYSIEDFKEIIKNLRGEYGCPWDKRQTHGSLTTCMLDEATEAVQSMKLYEKTKDGESLREELGDVLMQVVLNSQIAEEEGLFTFEDVVDDISKKMVRRHPHVFHPDGRPLNGEAPDPKNVKTWQQIKEEEKSHKNYIEPKKKKRLRRRIVKWVDRLL